MTKTLAKRYAVPVALHLDHGKSMEVIVSGIKEGFTSVMYDGSELPFAENVEQTRKIVEMAHAVGISVEGEIGHVGVGSDEQSSGDLLTRPEEAKKIRRKDGSRFPGCCRRNSPWGVQLRTRN